MKQLCRPPEVISDWFQSSSDWSMQSHRGCNPLSSLSQCKSIRQRPHRETSHHRIQHVCCSTTGETPGSTRLREETGTRIHFHFSFPEVYRVIHWGYLRRPTAKSLPELPETKQKPSSSVSEWELFLSSGIPAQECPWQDTQSQLGSMIMITSAFLCCCKNCL